MEPSENKGADGQFSPRPIAPQGTEAISSTPRINEQRARYVVIDGFDAGKSQEEIRQKLMAYGYSEINAAKLVEDVEREQRMTREYDEEIRGDPRFQRRFGGGVFLFGVVVLAGCITVASIDPGLSHNPLWLAGMFIGWAACFFGLRLFWRGLTM